MADAGKLHAALLASPGMGHLIPVLELAKRMISNNNFHVTVFVVAADPATASLIQSQTTHHLRIISLPPADLTGLIQPESDFITKIIVMMRASVPALRVAISSLPHRPVALIVDLFGTEAYSVADEFGMLRYVFNTSNAWFWSATVVAPTLDDETMDDHMYDHKPMKIPGCRELRYEDTMEAFMDRKLPVYRGYRELGIAMLKADGVLMNTWMDLEPSNISALRDRKLIGRIVKIPVYPVGPVVRSSVGPGSPKSSMLMGWLNRQPAESVIYVSFGSGGTLSAKQMTELAWGLELSQQRFLWVVRPPVDGDATAAYFNREGFADDNTPNFLPEGFLSRTRDVGLVVPMWAPQAEILCHRSAGGFLSHCGWNSTLESLTNGVPMIAWPLYAEQKMNAAMLSEDLGVAVRVRASSSGVSGVVEREEIEAAVRRVMAEKEGFELRKRAKELKYSGEKALNVGGSSYNSLANVARECEIRLQAKFGA